MIWCEIVVCDFYFSLQQSDVSTLKQENDNCRNQLNVDEQEEDRLLTKCRRLEQESRHNWLVDRVFISHHDELTDFQNKKINDWLSFSQTHDASSESEIQSSLSKKELLLIADSRSFSLTHDAHSENEMQSSLSKKKLSFREDSFCYFTHEDVMLHDLSARELSFVFSKDFDLTILFYLLAYFDEQSVSKQKIWSWVSISLAKFKARNRVEDVKMISSSSLLIECFVLKMYNRHELNCAEDLVVAIWIDLVSFYSQIACECEVYIVRHDENQILCQKSCLTRRITNSRNENIWFKEQICTWRSNVKSRNVCQVHTSLHMNSRW